jgi:predicted DNA-binding transcriptional regulator AlpA
VTEPRPDRDRLLNARQLGEYLGISTASVLDRFERGDLPGFRLWGKKGGPVRFRLSEIEVQLDGWRVNRSGAGGEVAPVPYPSPDPRRSVAIAPVPSPGGEANAS